MPLLGRRYCTCQSTLPIIIKPVSLISALNKLEKRRKQRKSPNSCYSDRSCFSDHMLFHLTRRLSCCPRVLGTNPVFFSWAVLNGARTCMWSHCWLRIECPQPSCEKVTQPEPLWGGLVGCYMSTPLSVVRSTGPPAFVITKPVHKAMGWSHTHLFHFTCRFNTFSFLTFLPFIRGQTGSMFFTLGVYNLVVFNGEKNGVT